MKTSVGVRGVGFSQTFLLIEYSGETSITDIILLKYLKTRLAIAVAQYQMVATLFKSLIALTVR